MDFLSGMRGNDYSKPYAAHAGDASGQGKKYFRGMIAWNARAELNA